MIRCGRNAFHSHRTFSATCWGFAGPASVRWLPRSRNDASSITTAAWSKYLTARNWNQLRANATWRLSRNLSGYSKSFFDAGERAFPDFLMTLVERVSHESNRQAIAIPYGLTGQRYTFI